MSCLSGFFCPFVLFSAVRAVNMNSSYLCLFFFSKVPEWTQVWYTAGSTAPLGMILETAFQKTRNVPVCPQLKLSPPPPNHVFHCISRLFLGVPKPWLQLWLFFLLPPSHQIICQFMQVSLQQTFFFFPYIQWLVHLMHTRTPTHCFNRRPLTGHPSFRTSSGIGLSPLVRLCFSLTFLFVQSQLPHHLKSVSEYTPQ